MGAICGDFLNRRKLKKRAGLFAPKKIEQLHLSGYAWAIPEEGRGRAREGRFRNQDRKEQR
jgi:hypothetical protein